jgi:hypothetical protein
MSDTAGPWWRQRAWWIDHWVDVVGAILVPLILFVIQEHEQAREAQGNTQVDLQHQAVRLAAADADNHQAIALLADLGSRTGPEQLPQRRAMAQAVLEYARQERLFRPSSVVAINYLQRECDQETYELLHQAVERAMLVTPKGADQTVAADSRGEKQDRSEYDSQLLALADKTRAAGCAAGHGSFAATILPKTSYFQQYLEVGCGETNSKSVNIPLSKDEQDEYQVKDVRAYFERISNVKKNYQETHSVNPDHESVSVQYSIEGPDAQLFGHCPGGGQATLIVESLLEPKADNVAQPQAPASAKK